MNNSMSNSLSPKEQKNHRAYDDVLNGSGPSMPDDPDYMKSYGFWYPLGADAADDRFHNQGEQL